MNFSSAEVRQVSETTGFRAEMVEKVLYLLKLLEFMNKHPFLKNKWALKGGTALNLFLWPLPRLSVDIDLNYIGALDREAMLEQRPKMEKAIQAIFSREGLQTRRVPTDHAGGKWRLSYRNHKGSSGNLEVDLNFMYRKPLWKIRPMASHKLGDIQSTDIPVLDIHELAAGKLSALLSRKQARDLFDSHRLLRMDGLDRKKLRIAFVTYGGMNRKDWRSIKIDDVSFEAAELKRSLLPTLNKKNTEQLPTGYGEQLVSECKEALSLILPFSSSERKFLDLLLDKGEIESSLLTEDRDLQERIENQPLLKWKALNVRKHKGL